MSERYVGWRCGRCDAPIAGAYSTCAECGFGPKAHLLSRAGTVDPIIAAAAEAAHAALAGFWHPGNPGANIDMEKRVRASITAAVAAERERCAELVVGMEQWGADRMYIATRIRSGE